MESNEDKVRKNLDKLLEDAKTSGDINNIQSLIDDYLDMGYNVKDYVYKCNAIARKLVPKK